MGSLGQVPNKRRYTGTVKKTKKNKAVTKTTRKVGRPAKYSDELAEVICGGIVDNKPLLRILEAAGVSVRAFYNWLNKYHQLVQMYARAREIQAELWEDVIIQCAWDSSDDDIFTEDGKRIENREWINRSRLKVDTLKWLMSKRLPKKYGDRLNLDQEEMRRVRFIFGGKADEDEQVE